MIPSRALDLGGIISESFRIVKRTYWRSALLFIIFTAPGILVTHFGFDNMVTGLQNTTQEFIAVSPDAPQIVRDYLLVGMTRNKTLWLYRIQYPNVFSVIDSVKVKIDIQYPDSSQSKIWTKLDSIADLVNKQTGKSQGDKILSDIGGGLIILIVGIFFLILGSVAASGALYDLECRAYEERPLLIGPILKHSLTQSMWLFLVQYVLIFLAMIIGLGLVVGIIAAISPILGVLGILISIPAMIYSIIRILFSRVALVSEELGPFEAIKRSLDLTKGIFWRVFGITFIVVILIYIAMIFIRMPLNYAISPNLTWLMEFIRGNMDIPKLFSGVKSDIFYLQLISFISSALTIVFIPAFLTTFYYDLRTRKEGELDYPETVPSKTLNQENLTLE